LPMGAVLLRDAIASALKPGDHATTFGGAPLVASVALEVVRTIAQPDFLAAVRQKGEWLGNRLARLATRSAQVRDVRGRGLMWGLELAGPAAPAAARHLAGGAGARDGCSRGRARVSALPIFGEQGAGSSSLRRKPSIRLAPEGTAPGSLLLQVRPAVLADVPALESLMAES